MFFVASRILDRLPSMAASKLPSSFAKASEGQAWFSDSMVCNPILPHQSYLSASRSVRTRLEGDLWRVTKLLDIFGWLYNFVDPAVKNFF